MPLSEKIIRVPVKLVDGQWELLYGGPVRVNEGAIGELHVDRGFFTDRQFLKALTERRTVPVLPHGAELRVALTIRPGLAQHLQALLRPIDKTPHDHATRLSADTRIVSIYLRGPTKAQWRKGATEGGLALSLEGMEPRYIESGVVDLPKAAGLESVDSLNHAFTRLSEAFEPWRKSHTGSIYERMFYQESNGRWYPLRDLRDRALVAAERTVMKQLWDRVAAELGTGLFK